MEKDKIKQELLSACRTAVEGWLRSTRGANAMGANATAFVDDDNIIQVRGRDHVGAPADFEIKLRDG